MPVNAVVEKKGLIFACVIKYSVQTVGYHPGLAHTFTKSLPLQKTQNILYRSSSQ